VSPSVGSESRHKPSSKLPGSELTFHLLRQREIFFSPVGCFPSNERRFSEFSRFVDSSVRMISRFPLPVVSVAPIGVCRSLRTYSSIQLDSFALSLVFLLLLCIVRRHHAFDVFSPVDSSGAFSVSLRLHLLIHRPGSSPLFCVM